MSDKPREWDFDLVPLDQKTIEEWRMTAMFWKDQCCEYRTKADKLAEALEFHCDCKMEKFVQCKDSQRCKAWEALAEYRGDK